MTLLPVKVTRKLDRPETAVLYSWDYIPYVQLLARLMLAYDPWILVPSTQSLLAKIPDVMTDSRRANGPGGEMQIVLENSISGPIAQLMNDPRFFPLAPIWTDMIKDPSVDTPMPALPALLQAWLPVFRGLAAIPGEEVSLARPRPLSTQSASHPLRVDLETLEQGSTYDGSIGGILRFTPYDGAFIRCALVMAYGKLLAAKIFHNTLVSDDDRAMKATLVSIERAARYGTFISALYLQPVLLRLRPWLRFLQLEDSQIELKRWKTDDAMEHHNRLSNAVLGESMHPWLAAAERGALPATRDTTWASGSKTLGMPAGELSKLLTVEWTGTQFYAGAREGGIKENALQAKAIFEEINPLLQEITRALDDMKVANRYQLVTAAAGFTSPGAPLPVRLSQVTFDVAYTDGMYASESIGDLLEMAGRRFYPVDGPPAIRGSWIGDIALKTLFSGEPEVATPSIAVEPEQAERTDSYIAGRLDPRMIQSFVPNYVGERNAAWVPNEPEEFAAFWGITEAELATLVGDQEVWKRLWHSGSGGGLTPKLPTPWYMSDRTKEVWRVMVALPDTAPATTVGLTRGRIVGASRIGSYFVRDIETPEANTSLDPAVEKSINLVASAWR